MYYIDQPGITGTPTYNNVITVTDSKFTNQKARKKAGGFHINNNYISSAVFTNVQFTNT